MKGHRLPVVSLQKEMKRKITQLGKLILAGMISIENIPEGLKQAVEQWITKIGYEENGKIK